MFRYLDLELELRQKVRDQVDTPVLEWTKEFG